MTLPRNPDVDTILASCIETLRDVIVPEVDSEWAHYSSELLIGSLEYARSLLSDPPDPARTDALAGALEDLRPVLENASDTQWAAALESGSPYEVASQLLVKAQQEGDEIADGVRDALHAVLRAQLDDEMTRAMPLFIAFARNMQGSR